MIVICCKCGKEYDLDNIFEVKGNELPVLVCPHCDFKHAINFLPFDNRIELKRIKSLKLKDAAPTVTTQDCTGVGDTTATSNGNITATGGVNPTVRGFCYMVGTSGDPTTANSKVSDTGSFGTGAYTKDITGLTANTGYRVRAYATNTVNTGYGTTVQLTTEAAGAPNWLSPTGYNDPNSTWTQEENAYDEDVVTTTKGSLVNGDWANYLELTINAISCNKVRAYINWLTTSVDLVSLDVYYSSAWHNIYEGLPAKLEWVEFGIGSTQIVTAMRFKFHATVTDASFSLLREADFWGVVALTTINIAAIPGVTAPETDATPVTVITETAQYTGTVTWDPAHNPFQASTVYTATITLTPKAGFTLTGVAADFFTVAGATTVTNAANSGVVTAIFPETAGGPGLINGYFMQDGEREEVFGYFMNLIETFGYFMNPK